jgi:hypothetical protein
MKKKKKLKPQKEEKDPVDECMGEFADMLKDEEMHPGWEELFETFKRLYKEETLVFDPAFLIGVIRVECPKLTAFVEKDS